MLFSQRIFRLSAWMWLWEASLVKPLVLRVIVRGLMMIVVIFSLNCFAWLRGVNLALFSSKTSRTWSVMTMVIPSRLFVKPWRRTTTSSSGRFSTEKDYGNIPQNRERIYIVGFDTKEAYDLFEFPEEIKLTTTLSDVIDFGAKPDEAYYYRERQAISTTSWNLKWPVKIQFTNGVVNMFVRIKTVLSLPWLLTWEQVDIMSHWSWRTVVRFASWLPKRPLMSKVSEIL